MMISLNLPSVPYVQRDKTSTDTITSFFIFIARSQLAQVADVATAPWLSDVLSELRSLKAAGVNMPGIGDFTISEETADRARQLLTLACVTKLPAPAIVPFSGGGISINWSEGGKELQLFVFPNQEVTYERKVEHVVTKQDDDTLKSDSDLIGVVDRYIASKA